MQQNRKETKKGELQKTHTKKHIKRRKRRGETTPENNCDGSQTCLVSYFSHFILILEHLARALRKKFRASRVEITLEALGTTKHKIFGAIGTESSSMAVFYKFKSVTVKYSKIEAVTICRRPSNKLHFIKNCELRGCEPMTCV